MVHLMSRKLYQAATEPNRRERNIPCRDLKGAFVMSMIAIPEFGHCKNV